MPTLLVIDDDRACRASVRGAAEEMGWVVLEAADGLSGLDLARRYINELDLVVLDIHMPQLDGYWACLRLHELRPARPFLILPFTGVVDAVPFLAELGCAPPLLKPASRERLQEAFQAALGAVPRVPLPSAVLRFTQQYASHVEQAARLDNATIRVVVFASSSIARAGLAQLIGAAGATTILEAASPPALAQILGTMHAHVLASAATDFAVAAELAQAHGVALLLIAATPAEALALPELGLDVPLGVVVVDDAAPQALADGLAGVAAGQTSLPRELTAPLADTALTPREQQLVLLDLQGLDPAAIAARLGLETTTIHRYHTRIYQKLGLDGVEELRRWAEAWIQRRRLAQ